MSLPTDELSDLDQDCDLDETSVDDSMAKLANKLTKLDQITANHIK